MTEQMQKEDLIVLYEDNHVIVVLKPQNVPSCEDETKDKDLLTVIKEHIKERENKQGNVYVGLVHRLDRPTGGVMVFAKSIKVSAKFQAKEPSLILSIISLNFSISKSSLWLSFFIFHSTSSLFFLFCIASVALVAIFFISSLTTVS